MANSLTSLVSGDWTGIEPKINVDIRLPMEPSSPWLVLKLRHWMADLPSTHLRVSSRTLAVVVATTQARGMASIKESHSCPCKKTVRLTFFNWLQSEWGTGVGA